MAVRTPTRLLRDERGLTLVELLIVLVLLAILLAIAVPSYLQYRDNAYQAAAKSGTREAVIAAVLYYEANSSYAGMTIPRLKTYDSNLPSSTYVNNSGTEAAGVTHRATLDASHFCVYATAGRWFAYQLNPTGLLTETTVASAVCS
ncbi:MAG TPA: prepilin-type N-terminal cleavage/methylation domain-containing protein [Gaiellaceae bacterium]|nr:prepilin-type N-terminal cleavage/methylation domain-containing protein [Gaiellaceae bacterium]